jgi:hypothetical protein
MASLPRRPHVAKARLPQTEHDAGDRRTAQPTQEIGELLGLWLAVKVDEVDAIVEEARSKADAIPDRASIAVLLGELLLRIAVLDREVAELKGGER